MHELDKVAQLLYGPGEVMPGVAMSCEQARERVEARGHSQRMPYCIVSDWVWHDLIVPSLFHERFQIDGQQGARLDTVLVYKLVGVKAVLFTWPHLRKC